jgi:hypothetical protein
MSYRFTSEGTHGIVEKLIIFQATHIKHVFNLAFGDMNPKTGEIDDLIVTNNGDGEKVLITVATAVFEFTEKYKNCFIYLEGSTKSRNRLYQMGITRYWKEISKDFEVLVEVKGDWIKFEANLKCEAFLVNRK